MELKSNKNINNFFIWILSITAFILFVFIVIMPVKSISQKTYIENHPGVIEYNYSKPKQYMKIDSLLVDTSRYVYEYFKLEGEDVYLIKIKSKNEK